MADASQGVTYAQLAWTQSCKRCSGVLYGACGVYSHGMS